MAPAMATRENVFILSLRQQVIFPAIRTSITIQPQTFAELCEFCEKYGSTHVGVGVVSAKPSNGNNSEELYEVGTYCRIASHSQSTTKVKDKEVSVVTLSIEGQSRFAIQNYTQISPYRLANIRLLDEKEGAANDPKVKALMQNVEELVTELLKESQSQNGNEGSSGLLKNLFGGSKSRIRMPTSPSVLADMIAAGLSQLSVAERQQVLETLDIQQRLELVLDLVQKAVEVRKMSREISLKMQKRTEDELRETVLRRQLQELQREMRKLKTGKGDGLGGEEEEVDDDEEDEDDIQALRETLKAAGLSADAKKIAARELKRLQNIQPHHPEYTVSRTYLETLSSLPWTVSSKDDLDLSMAKEILDKDHYGLQKVKRRILEFLAVQKMRGDMKGPILCLHGPPGVGKTSLGRSIAKALGRKFHRVALGGVRDEAELRGHRRTYIGSMPGTLIQALISLKVKNPVILLDEIDKLTRNSMFNPSGAMLEILDPEQNHTFKDHYLNTPFDLSGVLFLCTCNDLSTIDRPLLDRMEVIDLSGYTVEEKIHIATTHLLPKQRQLHALERGPEPEASSDSATDGDDSTKASDGDAEADAGVGATEKNDEEPEPRPELPEEPILHMTKVAISDLVSKWTMESGVRSLERRVAQICRWAALRIAGTRDGGAATAALPTLAGADKQDAEEQREAERLADVALAECGPGPDGKIVIDAHHLPHIVGAEMFEPDLAERLTVGVSMGLSVSTVGGQLLFIEATRNKGSGRLTVTGQLGEVMKESVSTAMSLLRSKLYNAPPVGGSEGQAAPADVAAGAGVDADVAQSVLQLLNAQASGKKDPFGNDDIHVHFPAGAIPKDGPSAGVATTLALASLLLNQPVRSDTAVTGEITLRGHVLPVGGIRDKVLAAHRAGVRHVLVPFANQRHVKDEMPASAMSEIEVHFIKHIDEALAFAFAKGVKPADAVSTTITTPAPTFALKSKL